MANVIKTVIAFRRGTTAEWLANKDVIPVAGEPCYDLELHTLKIGDGVLTYEQLPAIGGVDVKVEADGKSIVLEDNVFKLMGFDAAQVGAQPRKGADNNIEWVVPSTETVDGLQITVASLQSDVKTLQEIVGVSSGEGTTTLLERIEHIETKVDGTGEDSIDAKIDAKINEFANNVSDDKIVNTLKELVDYVAEHGPEAANMVSDIKTLQDLVGTTSVNEQILDIVNTSGHIAEQKAKATFEHVKYEIAYKPTGTLVDYREKEIRVMCPVGTQFMTQNSGTGADANAYYIGFKAYAPDGAVSFKEDLAEIIADSTMYNFEGNDFAGIDEYGRKYSIVWLPVAKLVDDIWTYYGANSTKNKYIGWHYSVEWYDANGKVINSDCIRINLSNEDCHNNIEPFYMANVVKEVAVNGTVQSIVEGRVNVVVPTFKGSDEIAVGEDGTLSIKSISLDKIEQSTETVIIMDGGGAI